MFGINAASFGAVVVALTLVRLPPPSASPVTLGMASRIAAGARAAMAEPGCRAAIGLIAVVALLASPFIALVPAMSGVVHRQGVGVPVATALLVTAQGIGAVVGDVYKRQPTHRAPLSPSRRPPIALGTTARST